MSEDYPVTPRLNRKIREIAKKARIHFGVANERRVDIVACLQTTSIWTLRGPRQLKFQVLPDAQMGEDYALTSYESETVRIAVRRSVYEQARLGVGRARNTLAHELGHAVLHQGAPKARRALGNNTPKSIKHFESAEYQARVFAPSFLINDTLARTLSDPDEISITFGISRQSAQIYYAEMMEEANRAEIAAKMIKSAEEFRASVLPKQQAPRCLQDICSVCRRQTLFPVGIKYLCTSCGAVFDRFQDGDIADG